MTVAEDEPNVAVARGPDASEAGGILTVDLDALVSNWRFLGQRVIPAECAAVVKADAYGCGLAPVVRALAGAGCKTFFVAHLAEGRAVRAEAPEATVYVLNGLLPGTAERFAKARLRPVLSSLVEFAEWEAYCAATGWTGGAAVHVDTGMNRLGIRAVDCQAVADRVRGTEGLVSLVMSHFACAETPKHPLNKRQISTFHDVSRLFHGVPASFANSSGIFLGHITDYDLVRPGVALYGVNPTPWQSNPMKPVVTLKGRILQVREVTKGDTVGYGATWTAPVDARIAVVSIGYADGLPRAAAGSETEPGINAIVAGQRCPVAGRISMDLTAIDVTALPTDAVRRGDFATFIGDGITVDEVARHAGTIGYEILTSLGRRYRRVYVGG